MKNNDNEEIKVKILTPSEINEENAAIVIQFFFYKNISKRKGVSDKLLSKYIKLKNERITQIVADFNENNGQGDNTENIIFCILDQRA